MITPVVGAPETVALNSAVQPEVATKVPVREPIVPASAPEAPPAELKAAELSSKSALTEAHDAAKETASALPNINVRFRIDEKTNDVTVYLLNQETRQVIRTIPPGEIAKLTPGDLVNLFA
jgi:uncharacterized FlaG/YvyC family protein